MSNKEKKQKMPKPKATDLADIIVTDEMNKRITELNEITHDFSSFERRIEAVKELQNLDCQRTRDILIRVVRNDPVYKVRVAAHDVCRVLRVRRNGALVVLQKKPPRCIFDAGIKNKLGHIRNIMGIYDSEVLIKEGDNFETFKTLFQEHYPVEYDVYLGREELHFNKWLKRSIRDLPLKWEQKKELMKQPGWIEKKDYRCTKKYKAKKERQAKVRAEKAARKAEKERLKAAKKVEG